MSRLYRAPHSSMRRTPFHVLLHLACKQVDTAVWARIRGSWSSRTFGGDVHLNQFSLQLQWKHIAAQWTKNSPVWTVILFVLEMINLRESLSTEKAAFHQTPGAPKLHVLLQLRGNHSFSAAKGT